ncbi:PIF1-like helicase-domain-containing protein, partial [Abortiporus biennis]
KAKCYAVRNGREGPKIYNTWEEVYFEDELDSMPFQLSQDKNPHIVKPEPGPSRLPAVDAAPPVVNAPPPQDIKLSKEQRDVLEMVKSGRNVFFTGSAGTGKSVLLREIIKHCLEQKRRLAITASTGIASVNIGGCTVHSWSGIGLGKEAKEVLVCKLIGKPNQPLQSIVEITQLCVLSVSMIDGVLFDKLEFIARIIRRSDESFGGLQVGSRMFSILYLLLMLSVLSAFVDMLNAMRFGLLAPATVVKFKGLSRPVVYEDGIEPTDLFPTRKEVDNANSERLSKLPPPVHTYQSQDVPGHDERGNRINIQTMRTLLSRLVAPEKLVLKNIVQGSLVNGSVGIVIGFCTCREAVQEGTQIAQVDNHKNKEKQVETKKEPTIPEEFMRANRVWPKVRFQNGSTLLCIPSTFEVNNSDSSIAALRQQVPLILAWALSIHKSQGQTLERVRVNLRTTFEKGQGKH